MGVNKVILIGNVGRDPECKALPSGNNLAKFSLATTDRRSKDEQGNPRTEWHNIVAWGKLADICERWVKKGKLLYVEGSIRTRSWEQDGQKKYMTEIHMENMEMLGGRGDEGGNSRPSHVSDDYGPGPSGGPSGGGFPGDADDVPF